MAKTYEPIATNTLGSNTASVTFSSIPQTYTDLVLIVNFGKSTSNPSVYIQFNSDTATNYSLTTLQGTGTAAASARSSNDGGMYVNFRDPGTTVTSNVIGSIMDYSNTTTYKTALFRFNESTTGTATTVGLWRSTSAINTVKVAFDNAALYLSGSTFTLYGIKEA